MADETTSLLVTYVEEARQLRTVGKELTEIKEAADRMLRRISAVKDKLETKAGSHSNIANAILNANIVKIEVKFFIKKVDGSYGESFSVATLNQADIEGIERILKEAFETDIMRHMTELRNLRDALEPLTTDIIPDV